MKNKFQGILLVLFCVNVYAQKSVGFVSPDSMNALSKYVLPTWRYTSAIFNTQGQANESTYNRSAGGDLTRSDYSLFMGTEIAGYSESKNSIRDLNLNLSSRYDYRKGTWYGERKMQYFRAGIRYSGSWKNYGRNNHFWMIGFSGNAFYEEEKEEYLHPNFWNKNKMIDKDGHIELNFGLGTGKIRNVSPIIRALRLQERYRVLCNDQSVGFTPSETQAIAHEIAKISGYTRVYDRHRKSFWQNVFDQSESLKQLSPFETFYLSEVLKERIGDRYEGWEIAAGPKVYASRSIQRLGWFGQFRRYKNLTLERQIGGAIGFNFWQYTNETPAYDLKGDAWLTIEYLWALTDRMLSETRFTSRLDFAKINYGDNALEKEFINRIESRLNYFIEDNLSFYVNAAFFYYKYDSPHFNVNGRHFGINFGLRYYLKSMLN